MICISFQSQSTVFRLASLFPPLSPSLRTPPIRQQTTPCFWPSHHLLLMDAGSHATDGLSTIKKRKKEKREGRQKNWRAKRDSKKRTQRRICFQPVFNLKDKKNLFFNFKDIVKDLIKKCQIKTFTFDLPGNQGNFQSCDLPF